MIEDESEFRTFLLNSLGHEGYEALGNSDGEKVISQFSTFRPNLILLDMNLPNKDGMDILREIRGHSDYQKTPVIVITGRDDEKDIVRAFNHGADDYLTKPFTLDILWARMRAVLRRSQATVANAKKLTSQDLTIDLSTHQVFLVEQEIKLTLTEFNILNHLMVKIGQVIPRDELRSESLKDTAITDRTLDVHMTSLRKKLAHRGPDIVTIRGVGFRFVEDVQQK